MTSLHYTQIIKQEAHRLGFDFVGISKAGFLEEEAPRLEQWLTKNMHGKMSYMERYFDKRLDPRLLVDDAKSVISLLLNYYPEKEQESNGAPRISRYAYGKDYHTVIKEKLALLMNFIRENVGDINGRAFTDSAPVLDRAWAKKSGIGWIGKNSNLINPKAGSYFFIAELIVDLELTPDGPINDYCGTCTRCIDACPTDAIVNAQIVDGSKCISYFTIELKEQIPQEMIGKFGDWAFGCDICQEVCPWNRFSTPANENAFSIKPEIANYNSVQWHEITEDVFNKIFADSPLKRTGYNGLKRNLEFISKRGGKSL